MADSIVRLKVESSEYDAKLKRAAEGLTRYANECRKVGGTMEVVEKETLEYVKSLGKMETTATTAQGKIREMSKAITDFTVVYRNMTDEEKKGEFGRALAQSIDELTERAGEMRDAMADVQASIKNASSDTRKFDQIAGGAQVMTAGFQTMQGAAKMFGIEIGNNIEVLAKLQAAMAVTNGLQTIQTNLQKQSALMQGVLAVQAKAAAIAIELEGKATKGATVAQAAFNAVAKANPYVLLASAVVAVGTALFAFSGKAKDATEATNENTKAMDAANKMAEIWKNTLSGTFSTLMTKYDGLKREWVSLRTEHEKLEWIKQNQNALKDLGSAVTNVKTAEDFFNNNTDAVVQSFVRRAQAAARVAQLTELYRKQIELLDKKSQASTAISEDAARNGRSATAGQEITDKSFQSSRYGRVNAQGKWVFSEQGAQLYSGTNTSGSATVMAIDVELNANAQEIEKVKSQITNEFKDGITIPVGGPSGGGGGGGSTGLKIGFDPNKAALAGVRADETTTGSEVWQSLTQHALQADDSLERLTDAFDALNKSEGVDPKKRKQNEKKNPYLSYDEEGKATAKMTDIMGGVSSGIGQMVSGIEALGIEVPEGIKSALNAMQGITSILTGISTTVLAIQAISTADTLIPFARGGIVPHAAGGYAVPGNHYSGDVTPILANSGEMVLSRAQQNILAGTLEGNGLQNLKLQAVARGEDIFLVMNRFTRRSGKGELVTWK